MTAAFVRVFGTFAVEVDGREVHIRTRPAQAVLARLCLSGAPMPRAQLAAEIWPDEPFAVSGNRLRTNLVILRQALAPYDALISDRTTVGIDRDTVRTDVSLALACVRRARLQQDLDKEIDTLQELLAILDQPLLRDFDDEWMEPHRTAWIETRTKGWLRVAQVRVDAGQLPDAQLAAAKALELEPWDSNAWILYLRLSAEAGLGDEALARFRSAEKELEQRFHSEFPREVLGVVRRIESGLISPSLRRVAFTSGEKKLLIEVLEHMATHDPMGFQRVIGSPSFRAQVFRKPNTAFDLISNCLLEAEDDSDAKISVIRVGLVANMNLAEQEETDKLCQWLIAHCPEDSLDHIMALHHLSFLRFEQRDWEAAYGLADRALSLASQHQTSLLPLIGANRASLNLHSGKLDEAEAGYLQVREAYSDAGEIRNRHNYATLTLNLGFLKSMALDWEAARDYALDAWRRTSIDGFGPLHAMASVLLGFTRVALGSREDAKLIVDGLAASYRNRNTRFVEIGIDYAAGALACLGDGANAIAALDAIAPLRNGRRHSRSPSEKRFADWVRAKAGSPRADAAWGSSSTLVDCVMHACEALESQLAVS